VRPASGCSLGAEVGELVGELVGAPPAPARVPGDAPAVAAGSVGSENVEETENSGVRRTDEPAADGC